jgi:hypothetical protein
MPQEDSFAEKLKRRRFLRLSVALGIGWHAGSLKQDPVQDGDDGGGGGDGDVASDVVLVEVSDGRFNAARASRRTNSSEPPHTSSHPLVESATANATRRTVTEVHAT